MSESEKVEFEAKLKQDLRRVDAPHGFADRVMLRASQPRQARLLPFAAAATPMRHWMAVAAVLLVALMLGFGARHVEQVERQRELNQEQAKARAAAEQFAVAMQVTGRTLFVVQQQIDHAGTKASRPVNEQRLDSMKERR